MRAGSSHWLPLWAVALLAPAGAGGTPAVPAKPPVSHEALWLMKRVGAPAASPDGRWVAFSVTESSYNEKDD